MPTSSSRRAWTLRALAAAAFGVFAHASGGCISIQGVHTAEVEFPVQETPQGTFFGWSEITIEQDISSVEGAELVAVTLDVMRPEGTPDLTFLNSLIGEAVVGTQRTLLVQGNEFPAGEQAVVLDVVFEGNIKPFFQDGTIRIEWTGTTNPSFDDWPADGFWMRGRVKVRVE